MANNISSSLQTMSSTKNGSNYCDNLVTAIDSASFSVPETNLLEENNGIEYQHRDSSNGLTNSLAAIKRSETVDRKKEVYKLQSDWLISNVAWSNDNTYKLALTSYIERYTNFVQLVRLEKDEVEQEIDSICTFEHPYPATKILWTPQKSSDSSQLLATTADYLRLWRLDENELASSSSTNETDQTNKQVKLECLLSDDHGPLTSFDWTGDANLIVTSSFDATCSVWDVNVGKMTSSFGNDGMNHKGNSKVTSQDHHIYDVAWSHQATGKEEIILCQDNSIRLFDLRQPTSSTVLYEMKSQIKSDKTALVRVNCSRQESNLVASFADNSSQLLVIDLRKTGQPLCVLAHQDSVNSISWSPKSSKGICSGGDNNQALIWQVPDLIDQPNEPLLAYRADGKINAVSWAPSNKFIAIGFRNILEFLRV